MTEVPDRFQDIPPRNKRDAWMWRYRGRMGRTVCYSYVYKYPDGRDATKLEFFAQWDYSGPKPGAPVPVLHHIGYRRGFTETPKRVARCRRKGKDRSRRSERRRARQEMRRIHDPRLQAHREAETAHEGLG